MEDRKNILLVFALASEAADEFETYRRLITGIGKINAAYQLSKEIQKNKPDLIVNLGSAGSAIFKTGEVVCCTHFIQRDMDVQALGYAKYETPFLKEETILDYGLSYPGLPEVICGTGDSFEENHHQQDYNVVDMEAYALARVAKQEGIPFLCLKYISDGADDKAAKDWEVEVHRAAKKFKTILNDRFESD